MKYADLIEGQTVWITGGLDKGKKGTVEATGWGVASVTLDGDTKAFSPESLTTKDPHLVPLPPNFLPSEFELGDVLEVFGHTMSGYIGVEGKVTRLPTSTSYSNGGDRRYEISVTVQNGSTYIPGTKLYFEPKVLRKAVQKERIVGNLLLHDDVKVGDTLRVELRSGKGGYRQLSIKEGRVASISKRLHPTGNAYSDYTFRSAEGDWSAVLNYGHKDEQIFLVKAAEDPWKAIVEGLTSGTVVVRENDNGSFSTFVKSPDSLGSSQWHVMNSLSTRSSSFVSDSDIIRILNDGKAEFVHKVRRPVPPPF